VAGVAGFVYSIAVLRRAMRQRDYKPVLEDWVWHAALPMTAYAALVHAGIRLTGTPTDAPYVVAGSALLLVFIGIHNAWDTVMYVTVDLARERGRKRDSTGGRGRPSAPEAAPVVTPGAKPTGSSPAGNP
jgi:hypothetical protein